MWSNGSLPPWGNEFQRLSEIGASPTARQGLWANNASLRRQHEDDKRTSVEQRAQPESGLPRRGGLASCRWLGDSFRRLIGRFFRRQD